MPPSGPRAEACEPPRKRVCKPKAPAPPPGLECISLKKHEERLQTLGLKHMPYAKGRSSRLYRDEERMCIAKVQLLMAVEGRGWYSLQVYNVPEDERETNHEKIVDCILDGKPLTPPQRDFLLQNTTHDFFEEEVVPLQTASQKGLTVPFQDAYYVPLQSKGFRLGVIIQTCARNVLGDLRGRKLADMFSQLGGESIIDLTNRLSKAGFLHMDLNPGNLYMRNRRLFVIDLAGTRPDMSSHVRVHPMEESPSTKSNLETAWRYACMLHKFIEAWSQFAIQHPQFRRRVYEDVFKASEKAKRRMRTLLEAYARAPYPTDKKLYNIREFYWGGDPL